MNFVSTRIITEDVTRLIGFYEHATGFPAVWSTPDFAELVTPSATLAVGSTKTVALFAAGAAHAADNHSVIIEFRVDDVDDLRSRLADRADCIVQDPTTMPWGNRSFLVRDPDGNLVNFFTPVTSEAIARIDGSVGGLGDRAEHLGGRLQLRKVSGAGEQGEA